MYKLMGIFICDKITKIKKNFLILVFSGKSKFN